MAGEANLGTAVFTIKAENKNLKNKLAESQKEVKKATGQISTNLSAASKSSQKFSMGLILMEKVAAATGIQVVSTAKNVGELGRALGETGQEFSKFLSPAVLAQFGVLGAVLATIAGLVAAIFKRQSIANWIEGVKKAEDRTKALQEKLALQNKEIRDQTDELRRQIRVAKGIEDQYHRLPPPVAKLSRELDRVRERQAEIAKQAARIESIKRWELQRQKDIAKAIDEQWSLISVLRGEKTMEAHILEKIEDLELRSLNKLRMKLEKEKELKKVQADRIKAMKQESENLRKQLGLLTAPEAYKELELEAAMRLGQAVSDRMKQNLIGLLPPELRDTAKSMYGIGGKVTGALEETSAFGGRSGLRALAAAESGAVKAVSTQTSPELKELKKIKEVLDRIHRERAGLT